MADPWADDLALALELCDEADALSSQRFRALDLVVDTKPDSTPVTDADRGVEQLVRTRLATARPDDAVLGEEYGATGDGPRQWVLDPIDGTKSYARGVPVWATLLALLVDGEVVVGVASAPALGRRWWATRGGGAYAAEAGVSRPICVSRVGELADASLSYSSLGGWPDRGRLLALADAVWRTRAYGDFWSYALVAEGVLDIATEPEVSLWDLAPLALIVEEAGGRFTGLDGARGPDRGSALASNGLLHDATLALLR
ncbi:MAG: inositol monophosphatase family protein [Mycobacteriales bacterium]